MNETIRQDDRYPEWMKAWNAKAAEIDQQIIDYFQNAVAETGEALDGVNLHVQNWWDSQPLDDVASAEYQKAKADAKLFKAQVENRIQHLVANGKIAVAKARHKADQ